MLTLQLTGQHYNKTEHRRRLQKLLNNRSDGSIERKHQNISAILIGLHCPWITGYKPLGNYQALLLEIVEARLKQNSVFDQAAMAAVQMPAVVPKLNDFSGLMVDPPKIAQSAEQKTPKYQLGVAGSIVKRDYIERESRNSSLGLAGEKFIVQYEQWRLSTLGEERLAGKVEHVSVTQGDGLGFDVLSYDATGRERFIEVKTTSFGKETPFFITRNEVGLSKAEIERFHIYRLFDFRKDPRVFSFRGPVDKYCKLDALVFQARFS
ncbi:MAG: DUF3883 domain-containing protein [Burkholderiales bacterium]|nr:DUF3883 domain-containing protein [Burkholderiales bacterium]